MPCNCPHYKRTCTYPNKKRTYPKGSDIVAQSLMYQSEPMKGATIGNDYYTPLQCPGKADMPTDYESLPKGNKNKWCTWLILTMAIIALVLILVCLVTILPVYGYKDKVISCYYTIEEEDSPFYMLPGYIDPHLCTHINVGFAQVANNNKIHLTDHQRTHVNDVVFLKKINPKLKILLSVSGSYFSQMVEKHETRKEFIKSAKHILETLSLDGIDLDWEFPVFHDKTIMSHERMHFSQLMREINKEFIREKRGYLLTVALTAAPLIAEYAYDIDQVNLYVDYANIMTYDYHLFSKSTPFTGLNSPLYARDEEQLYLSTLNVNCTLNTYLRRGLGKDKIVIGIPTYGHTFELVNEHNSAVGSPARGPGNIGVYGYISFPALCNYIKTYNDEVNVTFEPKARVPYLHRKYDWVSFENKQSVLEKAKFIRENDLRGAMVYSLNADDSRRVCERNVKFVLTLTVKETLKV